MSHPILYFVVYRLLLLVLFAYENIVTVMQLDNEMLQPFQICALVMPGSCFHEIWKLLSSVTDLLIIADSKNLNGICCRRTTEQTCHERRKHQNTFQFFYNPKKVNFFRGI